MCVWCVGGKGSEWKVIGCLVYGLFSKCLVQKECSFCGPSLFLFFFSSFLTHYTQRTLEETNIGDTWEKGKHRKQTNKQTNKQTKPDKVDQINVFFFYSAKIMDWGRLLVVPNSIFPLKVASSKASAHFSRSSWSTAQR